MNLVKWVENLGAGWWVEWRNAREAEAKSAWNAVVAALQPLEQDAIALAEKDGVSAVKAAIAAGGSASDMLIVARNAIEASVSAAGVTLADDAKNLILPAVSAAAVATATTA